MYQYLARCPTPPWLGAHATVKRPPVQINTAHTESVDMVKKIKNTCDLLDAVYNQQSLSSIQLRQILSNEIQEFSRAYNNYQSAGVKFKEGHF